jgi:hypothetical protein
MNRTYIQNTIDDDIIFLLFVDVNESSFVIFIKTEMKRTLSIVCFFSFTLFIIANSEFFRSFFR